MLLARGGRSLDGEPNLPPEQFDHQMRLGDPFVLPVSELADFCSSDVSLRGGVRVATRDGDGKADLIVGSGDCEPGRVRLYRSAVLLAGGTASQELDRSMGLSCLTECSSADSTVPRRGRNRHTPITSPSGPGAVYPLKQLHPVRKSWR